MGGREDKPVTIPEKMTIKQLGFRLEEMASELQEARQHVESLIARREALIALLTKPVWDGSLESLESSDQLLIPFQHEERGAA